MKTAARLKKAIQQLPVSEKVTQKTRQKVSRAKMRVGQAKRSLDEALLENPMLLEVNKTLKVKLQKLEKDKELATALAFQVLKRAQSIRQEMPKKILAKVNEYKSQPSSDE